MFLYLVHRLYWMVRDGLVALGLRERPRFYMQRHPAGAVRARRGGRPRVRRFRRFRRLSLRRLLAA